MTGPVFPQPSPTNFSPPFVTSGHLRPDEPFGNAAVRTDLLPARKLRVLDLFSGIGGFSLGLERTGGFETVAFCEIEPYACAVLRKRFPGVPNLGDVTLANFEGVDAAVITAGFPCQDLSVAGKGAGLAGERSGLFREVVRAVRVVRPMWVVLENVAALHVRGLGEVLGALAALGYDTRADCIPASHVGAPHNRDRTWIVAHAFGGERWQEPYCGTVGRMGRQQQSVPWNRDWQGALRELRRMDDGSAYRVDRVDTLRNAVVPQIPELIGNAILDALRTQAFDETSRGLPNADDTARSSSILHTQMNSPGGAHDHG